MRSEALAEGLPAPNITFDAIKCGEVWLDLICRCAAGG